MDLVFLWIFSIWAQIEDKKFFILFRIPEVIKIFRSLAESLTSLAEKMNFVRVIFLAQRMTSVAQSL
jgi:hypothetical protein